jgi:glutathione S-transferase
MVGEKRLAYDPITSDDAGAHLPVFVELDGARSEGLWAIVDHLEGNYPEHPLTSEDPLERGEVLRWLDWAMGPMHDQVTHRIVFEKGAQRYTGAVARSAPDMNVIRQGREALRFMLKTIGQAAEANGNLATRECTLADLAVAAHISALDYFGEIPWAEYPPVAEWYVRMKSRPSFRSLLADRVPGQPPTATYAELDF